MDPIYDVVIIGGGINGAGSAADAAMRGLSVLLCEKDDLASKTSSSSTKLIHGGLRYLENHDFKLVKKALKERQTLLELAPHLIKALAIVLPYQKTMRSIWILRLGLYIYDHLNRKSTFIKSKLICRDKEPTYFSPLVQTIKKGFIFYDGQTDDARLTLANAIQAKVHGATILTQTKLLEAHIINGQWQLTLQTQSQASFKVLAKAVINAAGPWVLPVNQLLRIPSKHAMSLIKGSHLVVHKLYEGEHAYLLQHDDHRVVFVIPYHHHTLIGTTDVVYDGLPEDVSIDEGEVRYLFALVNRYFNTNLLPKDIIRSWSGMRPLLTEPGKKPMELSRDYVYHFVAKPAPAVTLYSGKMTTYRQLASEVIDTLAGVFKNLPASRTHNVLLPGASLSAMCFKTYLHEARRKYYWLEDAILTRYLENYGTRTDLILAGCQHMDNLGLYFTHTLYQVEVDYLIREEWASTCEDILWRRTKLGLLIDVDNQRRLANYLLTVDSLTEGRDEHA